jgi:UDP-glucose 4-epimerase
MRAEPTHVLVTGGAGFIGSHIVDRLLADGQEVTVYDNLSSGKRQRVELHLDSPRYAFVEGDILDSGRLTEICRGQDVVWHLAANTDIRAGSGQTDLDLRHCVVGTSNVLEAMRRNGVEKILFASSGVVYGDFDANPLQESAGPLLPTSLYGAGKLSGEAFVSAYCHLFGMRGWIFRFANIIGGRTDHGVVYDFVQKLRRRPSELEVLGDGKQRKPYLLVNECVEAMLHAYSHVPMTEGAPCDVFNVSTDTYVNVARIAEIVIEEMGLIGATVRYTGGRRGWLGDAPVILMSGEKLKAAGWVTAHTSEEAVRIAAREIIAAG